MKKTLSLALLALSMGSLAPSIAAAADKTYQVTGPVLEVTDKAITVEKGKEKWTLARDKDTKVNGDLKVGAKVTVQYSMTATVVDVKADGKAAKGDAKAAKEPTAKEAAPAAPKK